MMISESQERMVAIVAAADGSTAVEAVLDRWELAPRRDRRGDGRRGELRAFWDGEVVGEIPARLLTDECPRYEVEREPRAAAPARELVAGAARAESAARAARARRTCAAARSSTAATTSSSARARCDGPGSTPPCCGCARRCAASPSRSTARAGSRGSTRSRAARSRCSRRRGTSPARAASRSASRTASTSATRRSPRSAGSSPRRSTAWRAACEALGVAGRLRERLALQRDERPGDPPDAGRRLRSGSSRTSGACRGAGARATSCSSPSASPLTLARLGVPGALRRGRRRAAAARPRGRGARSSTFLWRAAPLASLVHDAAEGGLAVCSPRRRSSRGRRRARARRTTRSQLFGEVGGARSWRARRAGDEVERLAASRRAAAAARRGRRRYAPRRGARASSRSAGRATAR